MRKLLALVAALGLCVTVSACGKDACEEAADKLVACFKSADCSALDSAQAATCEALKKAATSGSGATVGDGSCDGQIETAAEQINKCTLDPQAMCTCKP